MFHRDAAGSGLAISSALVFLILFLIQYRCCRSGCAELAATRRFNARLLTRVHYLRGRGRVLRAISRRRPLVESLGVLCRFVETQIPGSRCSALMLDPKRGQVCESFAPSLPEAYNKALIGLAIGPAVGSCGAAMYLKRPVMIADVANHPNWAPFRSLVQTTGMSACWSTPILDDDGQVLGAFAVYHSESRMPTRSELLVIHVAVEMVKIAMSLASVHRQLTRQSLRDDLTGLANRRGMKEWLAQHLGADGHVGVLLLDLDDFKPVNDTYGHAGGDKVLRVVAGRLRDLVGSGAIACRLGGDEFTVGLPDASLAELEEIARAVIDTIGQPISIDRENRVQVRCSIGIARYPEDGRNTEELLLHADHAMYTAKHSGKNQYRLWKQMDAVAQALA
ncbi:diguanylate cyclase domain-containing protein [Achromobacter denitrificans]